MNGLWETRFLGKKSRFPTPFRQKLGKLSNARDNCVGALFTGNSELT